jgi:hypothetical protein
MPIDQRAAILEHSESNNTPLLCVSDVSIINGMGRHAWIFTPANKEHITKPSLTIKGRGTVKGDAHEMLSARGGLQGQLELVIMAGYLARLQGKKLIKVTMVCNNQGVVKGCSKIDRHRIHHHRWANMDFYATNQKIYA